MYNTTMMTNIQSGRDSNSFTTTGPNKLLGPAHSSIILNPALSD